MGRVSTASDLLDDYTMGSWDSTYGIFSIGTVDSNAFVHVISITVHVPFNITDVFRSLLRISDIYKNIIGYILKNMEPRSWKIGTGFSCTGVRYSYITTKIHIITCVYSFCMSV